MLLLTELLNITIRDFSGNLSDLLDASSKRIPRNVFIRRINREVMLSKEVLQAHYREYASQPDGWVGNMEKTKLSIVKGVISLSKFTSKKSVLKIAVLGASDKRYIPIHQRVFETVLHKSIDMVTLDVDRAHLGNRKDVLRHDVTKKFLEKYDIIFSHELMKFLSPGEQFLTMKNSYNALTKGGIAMHIMHEPSVEGTSELRSWQHRVNPELLLKQLKSEKIIAKKLVFESESNVSWLRKTTVLVLQK